MSFSRAFLPLAITVLIALAAIILSLGMTDRAIKSSNHKLSYHSMALHIKNIQDFQETMVMDYTEWSLAFQELTINNNLEWFSFSIGGANLLNNKIHGLAFIKNDGTLVQQHVRNNEKKYKISQDIFNKDFDVIKQKTLSDEAIHTVTRSYFTNINGIPALISFSPITHPEPESFPEVPLNKRDFLVFWTFLTTEFISQTSNTLRLENLTFTLDKSPENYPLKDSRGNIICSLIWDLQKEDANPLALSLYTNLAMFGFLLVGGYFSYRRIFDLINQLDDARRHAESGHKIKSDFLATMSHELRTPLNSIIGFSDILKSDTLENLSNRQNEYLGHIQSSGKHLLNIINEILDMSKIEAGKYDLFEEEIDLKRTLNQSIVYIEKDARDKNISIIKKFPDNMPEFFGDEKVIRQIALNLLSNSIKFTSENGAITIGCVLFKNGTLDIYVDDNGIGISPEKIEAITEPYQQDQDHKTRSHQGTGLGLAITKAFVEMHQGSLKIKSELNVGTRVVITFPASRILTDLS